jgi:hypothetical protein
LLLLLSQWQLLLLLVVGRWYLQKQGLQMQRQEQQHRQQHQQRRQWQDRVLGVLVRVVGPWRCSRLLT